MSERPEHVREIKLPKGSEFRFELSSIARWVYGSDRSGRGGVYGSELDPGKTYVFSQEYCRTAVYSWQGCALIEVSRPRPSALGP